MARMKPDQKQIYFLSGARAWLLPAPCTLLCPWACVSGTRQLT